MALNADNKQCKWTIMIINTSGRKTGLKGEQIPYRRQQVIKNAVLLAVPSILLFQESPLITFDESWAKDDTLVKYKHEGHQGTSVMYNEDIFSLTGCLRNSFKIFLSKLLSEEVKEKSEVTTMSEVNGIKNESVKKKMKLYFESAKNISILKMDSKITPKVSFVCVSWHGPHKVTHREKIAYFECLIKCLRMLHREEKCPILVGGNFNIDIDNDQIKSLVKTSFFLKPYKASMRKIPFNGMKANCKDFFVTTKDFQFETIGWIDLKEMKDDVSAEEVFDHDPIVGYLSERGQEPQLIQTESESDPENDTKSESENGGSSNPESENGWSSNPESENGGSSNPESENGAACEGSPIMIMNCGSGSAAGKIAKKTATEEIRMQFIGNAIQKTIPSIVLFQEYHWTKLRKSWQADKILSRYTPVYNGGKTMKGVSVIYNIDRCVVKNIPEITAGLISWFKKQVEEKFGNCPVKRMCIGKVKTLSKPHIKFVCVSWHGPYKRIEDMDKIEYLKCFVGFLKQLHDDIALPILVGGDFNIKVDDKEFKAIVNNAGFEINSYTASKRREKRVIDVFLTTKDLQIQKSGYMDLKELENFVSPKNIFGHDPVVGHLSCCKCKHNKICDTCGRWQKTSGTGCQCQKAAHGQQSVPPTNKNETRSVSRSTK